MKKLFLGLTLSPLLFASILETTGTPVRNIEASDRVVPIFQEATVQIPGRAGKTKLFLTGAGIRTKKVVVVNANVYVAESFLSASGVVGKEPMDTIRKAATKVLRLTFLRDVDAKKIKSSFSDALEANGLEMNAVLAKFDYDLKAKDVLVFVGYAAGGKAGGDKEVLYVEGPNGNFTVDGSELATNFWKIWFGIPSDGGLEKLKLQLTGQAKPENN